MIRKNKNRNLIVKLEKTLSPKCVTILATVVFIILLLPILYLTTVNRASGDDYGYGTYTRVAWFASQSLIDVAKAIWQTIKQYYYGWQGTWFSIALFTLQPEVFSDGAYWIVAPMMLFLWIGSTAYLFKTILNTGLKIDKWSCRLITIIFLIINIQFVPSTKSSIFWYNGCAHYLIPFAMCQMVIAWLLKYSISYKKSVFCGILLFMTLLGGANYQAALFALIAACYVIAAVWFLKKQKRILTLLLPVLTELAGLVISMKAPGNKIRAGEEFGLSISKGMETIFNSFLYGIKDMGTYMDERPLIFAGLLFLFLIFVFIFLTQKDVTGIEHPVWLALMLYCLYSAMQAPAIYAGVEVSRGVLNTNFQVFMLTFTGILLIGAFELAKKLKSTWGENVIVKTDKYLLLPGVILCMVWVILFRSNVKDSTSYVCLDYIRSGQAADYKEQMDLQTELLTDEEVQDVVLPFINDVQGPLMHMPVTADETAWTNGVAKEFYGKNSVVAMERPKWIEVYGEK